MRNITKQNWDVIILWALILIFSFLVMSCGARKAEKKRYEESLKTELTDKSKVVASEETTEASETNIKKTVETTVNNQDQTITKKETIEPIDNSKRASYKDENGKLQELNNAKKTTETTTRNNNTKTEQKEKSEASKKEDSSSNKNESKQNDIKANSDAKKATEDIKVDRESWSAWNLLWLLIPTAALYYVWNNRIAIGKKIAGVWRV